MKFDQIWQAGIFDPEKKTVQKYFPAEVPGNVQYDYALAMGVVETFAYNDGVRFFEKVEDKYWEYRTELCFDEIPGKQVWFVAEGIDYGYTVLLDGNELCTGKGMYTPVELNLTGTAHPGSVLQIIIHPHPTDGIMNFGENRTRANQSCKPPVTYGWDWNPRLMISGLWQPAYIELRDAGYIRRCEPFYTLNESRDTAELRFETDCDEPVTYTISDPDGKEIYHGTESVFTVKDVRLWWCNGQGKPELYSYTVKSATHERSGRIGFRTLRLVRNKGAEGETAGNVPKTRLHAKFTVELNGRRIFIQGSNWVNPELFFGRITRERYEEQIAAAKNANMNFLRCWGGAGINKKEFYDLCDEYGILIWQEFMLSCNNYFGTPKYLKILEQEARSIIPFVRPHACLALWCGGNELMNSWSGMDDQSHALRLLNKLCYELDFDRPFLMTSPVAGTGHGGYMFADLGAGNNVFEAFQNAHCTAYTEFGVPGMTSLENLKKIIPEDELFPPRNIDSWVLHHGIASWSPTSWVFPETHEFYFGELRSIEEMCDHSDWMQSTGYQVAFEEARRQWPYCSMAINWCYNEPWITAANNSLISYPNDLRPAYFAVRDALRPVTANARIPKFDWKPGEVFTAELCYSNFSNQAKSTTVEAILSVDGKETPIASWNASAEENSNAFGPTLRCILPSCKAEDFRLILRTTDRTEENCYRLLMRKV